MIQVGDWVRTDMGREGKVVRLCENGHVAYATFGHDEHGPGLVMRETSLLAKIDPPSPSIIPAPHT